eukprot:SAG22_NODE_1911_length_3328_cov_2.473521_1_plen_55_part_00
MLSPLLGNSRYLWYLQALDYKTWGGVKRARLYLNGTDMSTPKWWCDIMFFKNVH